MCYAAQKLEPVKVRQFVNVNLESYEDMTFVYSLFDSVDQS